MRPFLQSLAEKVVDLARYLDKKSMPMTLTGGQWLGSTAIDAYRRRREPTPNELLSELKGTAWTCISINAAVCAAFPPNLYVATHDRYQPEARCLKTALSPEREKQLRAIPSLPAKFKHAAKLEQVLDHPLLTLLNAPNPFHSRFDLWELTQVYLETQGRAFWTFERNALGVPYQIWILPAQNMTPRREPNSVRPVDYWEYRVRGSAQRFELDDVIFFRFPDPRDPYTTGLAPLRAIYEQASQESEYTAMKRSRFENDAIPAAIVTPDEPMGEEERDRLEIQWNQRFRRSGNGKVLVAGEKVDIKLLQHSMGDLAALADMRATNDMIANGFHVPLSFLTKDTNLANLQAADHQHKSIAISPRLARRDERLNADLVPLFDPSGRLFLASEDPVPANQEMTIKEREINLKYGVMSVNEIRGGLGLPPAPWGNVPWLPRLWLPTDADRSAAKTENDQTTEHTE